MLRLKKSTVALLLAALTVSIMGAGTGRASIQKGSITGTASLILNCDLPNFPTDTVRKARCGMGPGAGGAPGTLVGVDWGINRGAAAKKDFYVNACAPICGVTAIANYVQPCSGLGLSVGAASGLATVTGATAIKALEISPTPGTPLPKPITTSTLRIPFSWFRVGVFAVISTGKLQFAVGSLPFVPAQKDGGPNKVKVFGDGKTSDDLVGGIAVGVFIPNFVPAFCTAGSGPPISITIIAVGANLL